MKRPAMILPIAFALLVTGSQAQEEPAKQAEQTYSLKRIAKVGDSHAYTLLIKTSFNGVEAVVTSKVKSKIVKVAADGGYTDESEETDTNVKVGDQDIAIPSEGPHNQSTDAKGYITEITGKSAEGSDYRTASAMALIYPAKAVKPGDTWQADFPANSKLGTFSAKANYTFNAVEKVGKEECARITWKYAESTTNAPLSAEGQMWIRLSDGILIKLRATVKNAPLDPSAPPADMTVEVDSVP